MQNSGCALGCHQIGCDSFNSLSNVTGWGTFLRCAQSVWLYHAAPVSLHSNFGPDSALLGVGHARHELHDVLSERMATTFTPKNLAQKSMLEIWSGPEEYTPKSKKQDEACILFDSKCGM